jgi:PPOX class probable F420-dependent enzyme
VRAGRRSVVTPEERRQFVRAHRVAIFGYNRRKHGPAMTAVYYVMNGDDEILVSTMADRAKARVVRHDERVSLCVLDEKWPLTYLQVYGHARLDEDFETATSVLHRVLGVMAGEPMPDSARPDVEQRVRDEKRVVVRITPYATFETPPRHVRRAEDVATLTHWTSRSLPW